MSDHELLLRIPEKQIRQPLQSFQLLGRYIRLVALGEAVGEKAVAPDPEQDDRSETARLAAAFPGDTLFEDTTSQIRIIVAGRDILSGLEQLRVGQAHLSGKPGKLLRDVYAHARRSPPDTNAI